MAQRQRSNTWPEWLPTLAKRPSQAVPIPIKANITPEITFGVELELSVMVREKMFNENYIKHIPELAKLNILQSTGNEHEKNCAQESTSSHEEKEEDIMYMPRNQEIQYHLLKYLFNHNLCGHPQIAKLSMLGSVESFNPHEHSYENWSLTTDASVVPTRQKYAQTFNLTDEEKKNNPYHVAGIELVSPILQLKQEKIWTAMLNQIFADINVPGASKVWLSGTEGLHIHIGLKNTELSRPSPENSHIASAARRTSPTIQSQQGPK